MTFPVIRREFCRFDQQGQAVFAHPTLFDDIPEGKTRTFLTHDFKDFKDQFAVVFEALSINAGAKVHFLDTGGLPDPANRKGRIPPRSFKDAAREEPKILPPGFIYPIKIRKGGALVAKLEIECPELEIVAYRLRNLPPQPPPEES